MSEVTFWITREIDVIRNVYVYGGAIGIGGGTVRGGLHLSSDIEIPPSKADEAAALAATTTAAEKQSYTLDS